MVAFWVLVKDNIWVAVVVLYCVGVLVMANVIGV